MAVDRLNSQGLQDSAYSTSISGLYGNSQKINIAKYSFGSASISSTTISSTYTLSQINVGEYLRFNLSSPASNYGTTMNIRLPSTGTYIVSHNKDYSSSRITNAVSVNVAFTGFLSTYSGGSTITSVKTTRTGAGTDSRPYEYNYERAYGWIIRVS